jgi:ribosome-associated toxin RatA of RatAB toxin-antitoxin module
MGNRIQRTRIVNAASAPTWTAVSEMKAVRDWHPNVASVSLLSEHNSGVGASRRVHFQDGNSVVETVTEESEREFVSVAMTELPLLDEAVVTISMKEQSVGQTEVTFTVDYTVKYGPLGWLMNALMMKRVFKKIFGISLAGLAYHLETGELVTDSLPAAA